MMVSLVELLDDKEAMTRLDSEGMVRLIQHFDEQITHGIELVKDTDLSSIRKDFSDIAILGMGGSAIGGDLLATILAPTAQVPVSVIRAYRPPAYIGSKTLVLASSYSGNTHETLSSLGKALENGAQVLAITSGGKLAELARKHDLVLVLLPAGQPPRASLGYMLVPLWIVAHRLGLCPDPADELTELVKILRQCATKWGWEVPTRDNYAKKLAQKLFTHPIFIYSEDGPFTPVAYRWRGQIQENAKMLVSSHAFPEFCHNEVTGYEKPQPYVKEAIALVLRDKEELPQLRAQVATSIEVMRQNIKEVIEILGVGNTRLLRALSLIYLGDWVSYYLAMLNRVDPTSIKSITTIKAAINKLKV